MTRGYQPRLADGKEPLYLRLADAIAKDIRDGLLEAGDRLPPHRLLARDLRIAVGTVSKAYAEAEARGLISGSVGRGSFVTSLQEWNNLPEEGVIDLSRNAPPPIATARRIANALFELRDRPELAIASGYTAPEGQAFVREAGARWLTRIFGVKSSSADRLIQCNGGQHGLHLVMAAILRPGDHLLVDAATFFGVRMLANQLRVVVHGLAMDEEGMLPEALQDAVDRTGARVVYLMPSLQNPTGQTMTMRRRRDLAHIAHSSGLTVIEDEAYRPLLPTEGASPFCDLLPEQTFHVSTMSKSLSPGLRLGFVLPPESRRADVLNVAQATGYSPAPLGGVIFAQWEEDGTADAVLNEMRAELRARTKLAKSVVPAVVEGSADDMLPHLWLSLTEGTAEKFAAACLRQGVMVTPPDIPLANPSLISGVRLCLGAPRSREGLARALEVVSRCLENGSPPSDLSFM